MSYDVTCQAEKKQKIEHATFWRIKPIVLGFVRIEWESGPNPRTIGFIRSKVAFSNFQNRSEYGGPGRRKQAGVNNAAPGVNKPA